MLYLTVVYVIEFQKRGLPHAHILLWLENRYKCKTPEEIDDIISAEMPSPTRDPEGYKAVTEYMLHGPCGTQTNNATCTVEGKCMKHYPKLFYAETTIDDDGYPVYRRRNSGVSAIKGKYTYDNSYVVPHNRYLLLKYEAHINVEWCNRSRAIKYLFKYLNKGPDRATIVIQDNVTLQAGKETIVAVDEIKNYLDCRFLGPCEAVWRINRFDINHCYPSVMKLIFHLPEQQTITLRDSQNLPELLGRESIKYTMFTDWFELNKRDPNARGLTYAQIPTRYVWHDQTKIWKERKQRSCIGHIIYCHPASGERYYLRMLLNVVKGVESFTEIRTYNDTVYATFKEACSARGLISDDKEWTQAILEASFWATGTQLRNLFVTILLFCELNSPRRLWDQTWEAISEDILYKKRKQFMYPALELTEEQTQNYCLVKLQELLHKNGKSLSDFADLPQPNASLLTNLDNRLIREELSYDMKKLKAEHQKLFASLNTEQRTIYDKVINSVHQKNRRFYLCIWSRRHRENIFIQDNHLPFKIRKNDCSCRCIIR